MSFATKQMLDAALPHILEAPKEASVVENLCFRPAFNEREFPQSITLMPDEGIVGDRWTKFPWMTLDSAEVSQCRNATDHRCEAPARLRCLGTRLLPRFPESTP